MSSQLIREVALELFTKKGYEGTSLANIAELVGIKKSSIYNHYKSKDDLFLTILKLCFENELIAIKNFFHRHQGQELLPLLINFLEKRVHDIEHSPVTGFLFRFIAFPPFHLKDDLNKLKLEHFFNSQITISTAISTHPQLQDMEPAIVKNFAAAFLTILNGSVCEKLLGRELNATLQLEAIWYGFERHLVKK